MKHMYKTFSGLSKIICFTAIALLGFSQSAKACHGVAIVSPTGTMNASDITITGSSDPATCGCGPYWMEVEVACSPSSFTGTAPIPSSGAWGSYPWYHSTLNPPAAENCTLEPYFPITIPFSQLCPGTTYYWRVRELVEASASGTGPWSAAFSFTTPGLPPVTTLQATANAYTGCPGDQLQLNATVTGGCPGSFFTYSWTPTAGLSNPLIANPTLTIQNSSVTYTVTVTGGCVTITSADDTVQVINGPPPFSGTISSNPTSVCSGGSSLLTLTGADPGSTYQWQVSPNSVNWFNISGATSSTYNTGPLTSTLYYQVIVTGSGWPNGSGCGTSTSAPITVTVNPSPIADAGVNSTICSGACVNLTGTGGTVYSWQPNNQSGQTINVCPSSTTTYTLTVTDANGCTDTDVVTVNVSTATITASPDVSICTGNNTILVASMSSASSFAWTPTTALSNPNVQNPTATPTVTTTYTVTGTNSFGCTAMDSVTVTVTSAPPLVVSNDTSLCNGGSATLTASGATSYSWSPGNMTTATITVSPSSTTTYVVTGNNNNCISYDTIVVTVAPPPAVYAGPDFDICSGTQATLNVMTTASSYSWQPTTGIVGSNTTPNITINPTSSISYTVTVVAANGCISTDTINVTVNTLPTVTATATDNSICIGQSTTLSSSGATTYSWIPTTGVTNPNAVSTSANPANTTTYQVIGTDANGCMDTASITITVNPLPSVYIIATPSECGDSTGTFTDGGIVTGTGPMTYLMNNQVTTLPVIGVPSGNYNWTITDANGCVSNVAIQIGTVYNGFAYASANPNYGVYPLSTNFSVNGSQGLTDYYWSFGDNGATGTGPNPSYTYNTPGTYTVTLVTWNDDPNCVLYDTITVEVVDVAIVSLPNVFTPNADGVNDGFAASISGVKEMKVEIYDRWGNLIHMETVAGLASTQQDVVLWDGKSKAGNVASDGVYYYVIHAIGYDTKEYPFTGFLQLLQSK
jgi:gliding motility-associated-like protein